MANSAFDPLRKDIFATINETAKIAMPPGGETQFSMRTGATEMSTKESPRDVSMQFNATNSPAQVPSQTQFISATAVGSSPMNNSNFAPPPSPPPKRDYTASLMMSESVSTIHTDLPSFKKVHHSGTVLARISMRALVTKKWKRVFWIQYGETSIILFRSKADFEEWVHNPYLSHEKRKALVKLEIDLKNERNIEDFRGYRATHVHAKYYNHSGLLHQFKVDKWLSQGPSIAGAFGSQNEDEIQELYTILNEMIKRNPNSTEFMNLPHDGTESLSSRSGSYGGYSSSGSLSSRGWSCRSADTSSRSIGSMNSTGSRGTGRNRGVMTALARGKGKSQTVLKSISARRD